MCYQKPCYNVLFLLCYLQKSDGYNSDKIISSPVFSSFSCLKIPEWYFFQPPWPLISHLQILKGHKSFINAVAYEPNLGQQIASVGDDNTCRVWEKDKDSSETKESMCFYLMFPGVSVCWHHEEPKKVFQIF